MSQLNEEVFKSFRVGLPNKESVYKDAAYRYFVNPTKEHSDKEKIAASWLDKNIYPEEKILSVFGWKKLPGSIRNK